MRQPSFRSFARLDSCGKSEVHTFPRFPPREIHRSHTATSVIADLACRESRLRRDCDRLLVRGSAPLFRWEGSSSSSSSDTSSTWTVVHPCRRSQTERRPRFFALSLSSSSRRRMPLRPLFSPSFASSSSPILRRIVPLLFPSTSPLPPFFFAVQCDTTTHF